MNIDYVLSAHGYMVNKKGQSAVPEQADPEVPTDPEVPAEPETPPTETDPPYTGPHLIYGVAIDTANSNPSTAVTYTHDAAGMTAGSAWDSVFPFSDIKPVMLSNTGAEVVDIDKNNFKQNVEGYSISTATHDNNNAMIRFPKVWYKIEQVGDIIHCCIATGKIDDSYVCYAHTSGETEKNYFYVGIYLSRVLEGKLSSKTGTIPATGMTLSNSRRYARAIGTGYNLLGFHQLTLLQILQLIRSKTLSSQSHYGLGHVDESTFGLLAGRTDAGGMYVKNESGQYATKIMGIEDFYGEKEIIIDGITMDANRNLFTSLFPTSYGSTNGVGHEQVSYDASGWFSSSFIKSVQGTSELGFLPKAGGGSDSTYFCDNGGFGAVISGSETARFLVYGGSRGATTGAGAFCMKFVLNPDTNSSSSRGARIMYL